MPGKWNVGTGFHRRQHAARWTLLGQGHQRGCPPLCQELRDVGLGIRKHMMELGFLPFKLDAFTCFSKM